jgi:hypothetical protein
VDPEANTEPFLFDFKLDDRVEFNAKKFFEKDEECAQWYFKKDKDPKTKSEFDPDKRAEGEEGKRSKMK